MSDTIAPPRDTAPTDPTWPANGLIGGPTLPPTQPEIIVPDTAATSSQPPSGYDQLARIEDKTSRIEEKFARSESSMQRVIDRFDHATGRMGEVALQSDLAAVRGEVAFIARQVRKVPSFGTLALTAIGTAVLTALVFVALLRFVPGLLVR